MDIIRRVRSRSIPGTLVACIAVGVIAGGGATLAAIPDSSGTVHLCYVPGDTPGHANLRVIDPATSKGCSTPDGEVALDINQRGPAGPPGPPNASGGDAYQASFNGYGTGAFGPGWYALPGDGRPVAVRLQLPAGTYAVFGKANLFSDQAGFVPGHYGQSSYWVDSIPVVCTTAAEGDHDESAASVGPGGQRRTTVSAELVHIFHSAGSATFDCQVSSYPQSYNAVGALPPTAVNVEIMNLRLVAVKLRNVYTVLERSSSVSNEKLKLKKRKRTKQNPLIRLLLHPHR